MSDTQWIPPVGLEIYTFDLYGNYDYGREARRLRSRLVTRRKQRRNW